MRGCREGCEGVGRGASVLGEVGGCREWREGVGRGGRE